ncbi:MAG: cupin domain-containing protein, partial [Pseudomonadales bacterium]
MTPPEFGANNPAAAVIHPNPAAEYYFEEGCFVLELSNSESDPSVSIARARVPVGGETRRHRLTATTERYVILEGHGELQVGDTRERVGPGDVTIIPAQCPQQIRNVGGKDLI